jgi:hypothetical protein
VPAIIKVIDQAPMLSRKLIEKISPESWGGIIDGTYAIILTLLTIELPVQILHILDRLVESAEDQTLLMVLGVKADIWFAMFNLIVGYFAVFIIIYDIWCSHRLVVGIEGRMPLKAILTSWTLFLCTLIPSLHYVVNAVRMKYVFTGAIANSPVALELHIARALEYPVIAIVYFFLFLQAASDVTHLKGVNTPADEKDSLRYIARVSLSKSILAIIIFLGVEYVSSVNHGLRILWEAPAVLIAIALLTYVNIDLFRWLPRSR